MHIIEKSKILPPSSLQSFIRFKNNFPGLILTDHGDAYVNKFYNSLYDNELNIKYQYYELNETDKIPKNSIQYHIANLSIALARSVYEVITHDKYDDLDQDEHLVIVRFHLRCK